MRRTGAEAGSKSSVHAISLAIPRIDMSASNAFLCQPFRNACADALRLPVTTATLFASFLMIFSIRIAINSTFL